MSQLRVDAPNLIQNEKLVEALTSEESQPALLSLNSSWVFGAAFAEVDVTEKSSAAFRKVSDVSFS